eukprot:765373-Hanusia_phi.AAC.1
MRGTRRHMQGPSPTTEKKKPSCGPHNPWGPSQKGSDRLKLNLSIYNITHCPSLCVTDTRHGPVALGRQPWHPAPGPVSGAPGGGPGGPAGCPAAAGNGPRGGAQFYPGRPTRGRVRAKLPAGFKRSQKDLNLKFNGYLTESRASSCPMRLTSFGREEQLFNTNNKWGTRMEGSSNPVMLRFFAVLRTGTGFDG